MSRMMIENRRPGKQNQAFFFSGYLHKSKAGDLLFGGDENASGHLRWFAKMHF
jgi:hypothetical protein